MREGKWKQWQISFYWAPKSLEMATAAIRLKDTCSLSGGGGRTVTNQDSILKRRDITLPTNVCTIKAIFFPVVLYGCESWTIKKAEQQRIGAFELWIQRRFLRVPWTAISIKLVNPKVNQSWIFIRRTVAEAPVLWAPDVKSRLTGKYSEAGNGWRQNDNEAAEGEMVSITNSMDMHLSKLWENSGEERSLECCSPWGHKESDKT